MLQEAGQVGECVVTIIAAHILPRVIPALLISDINVLPRVILWVLAHEDVVIVEIVGARHGRPGLGFVPSPDNGNIICTFIQLLVYL